MPRRVTGRAYARAGLLGNPSDVYRGKAIAISVGNFGAEVTLASADRFALVPGPAEALEFPSALDAWERLARVGCDDGLRLLRAAHRRFTLRFPRLTELSRDDPRLLFHMHYASDVPRQVGLSGSSAIVIAALRALAEWFEVEIPPFELAEMALAAEVEDLGITAGPMDRVIQAYEGVVAMDFDEPRTPDHYRPLDPETLPPLFVTWDPRPGEASNVVHSDVRLRWLKGDPEVRQAMDSFPALVDEGLACLERRDLDGFRACMDRNFDTRASIWKLSARDLEMIEIGRRCGAAVKMCGSGGAVVGALRRHEDFEAVRAAYAGSGYTAVRPRIVPGAAGPS
ncbi:MAG: mevalonate kinase family protein [Myxococcota bacterium]